jgi:hypothetical protein
MDEAKNPRHRVCNDAPVVTLALSTTSSPAQVQLTVLCASGDPIVYKSVLLVPIETCR